LRKIIFNDKNKRLWLEKLLHPLIREEMKHQIDDAQSIYCMVVIPLLFETEPNPLIDRVLVVDAPELEQIKRTRLRDNATEDEVKAILDSQTKRSHRLAAANDIIINDGIVADLIPQVNNLHGFYLALAQKNTIK
jgi:dephospho-CoA kinase